MFGRVTEPAFAADGVVRLGTDLCNWFLFEDGGGVVVVDAGFPAYRPQLERGLALLGRSAADVQAVVLTHCHADHTGIAEQLRRERGIPVYAHEAERESEREASVVPYLRYPHAIRFLTHFRTAGEPEPVSELNTFVDGEELPGGLRAIHTGGHTPGHSVFHHQTRRVLFVGDLICTVNPLTGRRGPQLLPRPLNLSSAAMLDALAKVETLDADRILVGHGETWTQGAAEAVRRARVVGPT